MNTAVRTSSQPALDGLHSLSRCAPDHLLAALRIKDLMSGALTSVKTPG